MKWLIGGGRESSARRVGKAIGKLIAPISAHECDEVAQIWNITFTPEGQAVFFLEYSAILLSVVDRFAFRKYGDPGRMQLMEEAMDVLRTVFCSLRQLGDTEINRRAAFKQVIDDRMCLYGECPSIMGDEPDHLVLLAARVLVKLFDIELPPTDEKVLVDTAKSIGTCFAALATTEPFRALT